MTHEHDVLREQVGERRVFHRVPAVLHDDGLAGELLDVRQRLGQDRRPLHGVARRAFLGGSRPSAHEVPMFSTQLMVSLAHEVPMFSSTYAWVRSVNVTVAEPGPACRLHSIDTSRCAMRADRAAASWGAAMP